MLREYDAVLGTLPGETQEKAIQILKSKGNLVSLVGPPDAVFAHSNGMNFFMVFVRWLRSHKLHRLASKRGVEYSFMLVKPNGRQLAEIGKLIEAGSIRPVIDKVFPFDEAIEALAYLAQGRAKGKVVVQMK